MSDNLTFGRHNDFVGGEASKGRIPGADQATSGHQFIAVDLPRGTYIDASLVLQIHPDQTDVCQTKSDMLTRRRSIFPPRLGVMPLRLEV